MVSIIEKEQPPMSLSVSTLLSWDHSNMRVIFFITGVNKNTCSQPPYEWSDTTSIPKLRTLLVRHLNGQPQLVFRLSTASLRAFFLCPRLWVLSRRAILGQAVGRCQLKKIDSLFHHRSFCFLDPILTPIYIYRAIYLTNL